MAVINGNADNNYMVGTVGDDLLIGGESDDNLAGDGGADTLIGGLGDDTLTGGEGVDVYIFNKGDGNDTIYNFQQTQADDKLILGNGFSAANLVLMREGFDLLITFGNSPNDSLRIGSHYDGGGRSQLKLIEFNDGTTLDISVDNKTNLVYSTGTYFAENMNGYDGADIIDAQEASDSIDANGGNDTVDGGAGDDQLWGGEGDDMLMGGEGDDYLLGDYYSGGDGADTLIGGLGDDTLTGGEGVDVYIFNKGDGNDTIYNFQQTQADDKLILGNGFSAANLVLMREGFDLLITSPYSGLKPPPLGGQIYL